MILEYDGAKYADAAVKVLRDPYQKWMSAGWLSKQVKHLGDAVGTLQAPQRKGNYLWCILSKKFTIEQSSMHVDLLIC